MVTTPRRARRQSLSTAAVYVAAGTTVSFTYHVTDSGTPPPGVDSAPVTSTQSEIRNT